MLFVFVLHIAVLWQSPGETFLGVLESPGFFVFFLRKRVGTLKTDYSITDSVPEVEQFTHLLDHQVLSSLSTYWHSVMIYLCHLMLVVLVCL